jgi:hypothetical protein
MGGAVICRPLFSQNMKRVIISISIRVENAAGMAEKRNTFKNCVEESESNRPL